ncbi:MAG: hypothetical protein IKZ51_03920 [Bacteroidales bacterium]|nr:hypothetical protein [Bacteroidales bacterium]
MRRILTFAALSALVLMSASCAKSRLEKMQLAKDVVIQCNPEVLEIKGGQIPATITVTCPKDYFYPQATMDVTPYLVYEGGMMAAPVLQYQGDKVKDNFKVISSAGTTVTEKINFKYVPGCEKARLELRGVIHYKDKDYPVDPVKVADGCIATYQLADLGGVYERKPDGYQAVIERTTEAKILYDVNSDKVKKSELETYAMDGYRYNLGKLQEDERTTVKGTQIVAYASPEGGKDYNAKLSDKRAGSAQKAWDTIAKDAKDIEVTGVEVKSMGQDWEGFQEAVAKSNIEDKDLILRVLSMYSDPAVRESEIRNMSQIYSEINKTVFPELRRARFVTSSEFRNYDNDELLKMAENGIDNFDEPSILRLAAISESRDSKETLYKYAVSKFNSDVARYNLAMLYLDEDKTSLAGAYLGKITNPDADVLNATGVVALRNEDYAQAAKCFEKSGNAKAKENLVVLNIIKGDYEAAAKAADGLKGSNACLANLLNGNLDAASAALTCKCPKSNYIRAIIAARKGNVSEAQKYLDDACSRKPALKERAARDIEFAALAK